MGTAWVRVAAVLTAATVAGCASQEERRLPLASLAPEATRTGGEFGGTPTEMGLLSEDVSPVQPAGTFRPAGAAPARREPAPGEGGFDYRADLNQGALPGAERVPVVTFADGSREVVLADAIVAKVNDEVITREDVLGPVRPQLVKWRAELPPAEFEDRCRLAVGLRLREEINDRLVVQEARRELAEEDEKQIELSLGQFLKDLTSQAGSALLLEEKLKLQGRTVQGELDAQRQRLLVQRYLRDRIMPNIHVSHSELLAYYDRVRDERYVEPTRIRMRLIVLKKSEFKTPKDARDQAAIVMGRLQAGEGFAGLARQYSHGVMAKKGGDWGYVTRGAFRIKEVDDVLFTLRTGEVGPIVETDEAFYLVMAEHRKDARVLPFAEVQRELDEELRDRRRHELFAQIIEELRARAYVQIMTENL